MHAAIFDIDLGGCAETRDRWRCGRSLATVLDALPGFVAFIAFESEDGATAGLCICVDAAALIEAQRVAEAWQSERGGQPQSIMRPLFEGEVIVQRGF